MKECCSWAWIETFMHPHSQNDKQCISLYMFPSPNFRMHRVGYLYSDHDSNDTLIMLWLNMVFREQRQYIMNVCEHVHYRKCSYNTKHTQHQSHIKITVTTSIPLQPEVRVCIPHNRDCPPVPHCLVLSSLLHPYPVALGCQKTCLCSTCGRFDLR